MTTQTIELEIDPKVINKVYRPMLNDNTPIQIFYGGSSSGKSYFLAERAVIDIFKGGRNYLVCRQVAHTVRGSVAQEITKIIRTWGLSAEFDINKTDGTITCHNGYQIIFTGLDDVEKLKSITPAMGVITDIWIEEATEIDRESMKQLDKRLRGGSEDIQKRIALSFNPILQSHWIYSDYFANISWSEDQQAYRDENIVILKTTYKDNRFLTSQDKKRLEGETDEYYRNVYVLGKWGILGDVIFKNWTVQDLSEMQSEFTNHRNGLDFGFSSDPAVMAITHYDAMRRTLYIYDEFYERGLTNQELAVEIINKIGTDPIACDSAEPKSIRELSQAGVYAYPTKKGKDSVNFGIQWLQGRTIIIDAKCVNAKREFSTYHWKKDKDGNALKIPVGKDDHVIDATRYALEGDMDESWFMS